MFSASTVAAALFLIFLISYFWKFLTRTWHLVKIINKIPGPPALFLLGNILDIPFDHKDYEKALGKLIKQYPRIMRIWLTIIPYIAVNHPESVETVLSSSIDIKKADPYRFLHPWLGTGLLNSEGDKWRTRRKLLTPAFHFRILKDFIGVFNEQSEILVDILSKQVGKEIDAFPLITNCTLDVICESAMGRHVNAQGNNASDYVKATDRIKDIITTRFFMPWYRIDWIFNLTKMSKDHRWCVNMLHSFTEKVIREKKAQWKPKEISPEGNVEDDNVPLGQKKRLAFLDLLLDVSDGGRVLNDNDIREEVDTFMFEGHDTTAAAISWTIYLLGYYGDIQKKVQEELDDIFDSDCSRPISEDDLSRMKYLECVIKETLRLYPSVPMIGRILTRDIKIDGYNVPTDSTIIITPYFLHRNPEVFPEPDVFDPDRFLPDNCTNRHPYAYIPFSAGPRNCIGQKFAILEEKVILASIFRSFNVRSLEPREKIEPVAELILKSHSGINVYLTPRN